jgi:hypothetical protein
MPANITNFIRKLMLFGNGFTFLFIAGYVLYDKFNAAYLYGYTLNGPVDGLNEFRAVYIGFWIGLTILFWTAIKKFDIAVLGDLALLLVMLQSLGRLLSFALDGMPNRRFVFVFFLEFGTSLLGLIMRPRPTT